MSHLAPTPRPLRERLFPNHEWILILLLGGECLLFSLFGEHFGSRQNLFEILRRSVEVGLLALALTPVIVSGGIDLSVGSMLGLCAVVFGWLAVAVGLPAPLAALLALLVGAGCGGLNAWLITRLRLPALIVTLGTYSLYRGLAEGLTGGAMNYTAFTPGFLRLGQGYLFGVVPVQLPLFALVAVGYWLLLHRTAVGRGLYAVGHCYEGARHAGLPVRRHLLLVYLLSGAMAALAAVIYVARLGQAKADAGLGYEMLAITAVVLGGTSIYGGRGTIHGTLLGLVAIVVLENGLRLAGQPAELAAILIGGLMLAAIAGHKLASAPEPARATEEFEMKNSQVAALCAVMLIAAAIVAGGLSRLSRAVGEIQLVPQPRGAVGGPPAPPAERVTIAMMPKSKGDPYFVSCRQGAEEAAGELGVELLWDGPTETDPLKQTDVVEDWIVQGVDVIAVSVANQEAIAGVLRKARAQGIKVITWDADASADARDFLVNQATPQGIGYALTDQAARILDGAGKFAIITDTLTAANQNAWIEHIKARMAEQYPGLELLTVRPSENQQTKAYEEAQNLLKAHPDMKLIMAIAAPAVPGAAEAVEHAGRSDVTVIGLSLPNMCKPFIHSGTIDCIVLWNTVDLGYLTVQAAKALHDGTLAPGATSLSAGRLGTVEIAGDEVLLGEPFVFTAENVDEFDF